MNQRDKSSRQFQRALILLTVLVVVVGGLGGVYYWRISRQAEHVENLKPRAIEQLDAGNYSEAVHLLRGYLGDHPDDVEALRAFADARQQVFDPKGGHIKETMEVRRRILILDPADEDSRRELLDLYVTVGFNAEAIELADKLLDRHPDDPDALRAKSIALFRTDRHAESLQLAKRYNELKPEDIEAQIHTLSVMNANGDRPEALVDRAHDLLRQHADDGRFLMLVGVAYQMTARPTEAIEYYKKAAQHLPADAQEVGRLARLMDQMGLSSDATQLLTDAEATVEDPVLIRLLVRRLWEQGRSDLLLERARQFDVNDPRADSEAIAVLGLALIQAGEVEQSESFVAKIESRRNDRLAQAWARLLRVFQEPDVEAERLVNVTESVLAHQPDHPYFHFFRGQALARQGKSEQAIKALQAAAERAPSWPLPLVRVARIFLSTGRPLLAAQVAQAVVQRAPNNVEAVVTFMEALGPNVDNFDPRQLAAVAQTAEQVVEQAPQLKRRMLPLLVTLDARQGNVQRAGELIDEGLALQPPLDEESLVQLANVSRSYDLGYDEKVLQAQQQLYGMTPRLAFLRAIEVASTQGADAAIATFDQNAPQNADPSMDDGRAWMLVRARLLDQLGHETATEAWRTLVQQLSDDERVLRVASDSTSIWKSAAAAADLVAKLRSVVGTDSDLYRVARAKQILADEPVDDRSLAEATALLLEVTRQSEFLLEPHLLLARCYERLGSTDRALESLNKAQQLAPQSVDVGLDRARALIVLHRNAEADRLILAMREQENLTAAQQVSLAELAIRRGGAAMAEDLLEDVLQQLPDNRPVQLLLARVYEKLDRQSEAAAIYDKLMEEPDAATVQSAARFYEMRGDLDKARETLEHLDAVDLPADVRAMLGAGFLQRRGELADARQVLEAAAQAGDARPQLWKQLIAFQLQMNDAPAAFASAERAAAAHPRDESFASLRRHQELVRLALEQPLLQPLSLYFLQNNQHRDAAVQTLELIRNADRDQWPMQNVLLELRAIADRDPQYFSIQRLLVEMYQQAGRTGDAADVAVRVMRALPDAPEPAWLASQALAAAGRWEQAVEATREYQNRAGGGNFASDVILAEAQIQMGEGAGVVEMLSRHLDDDATPAERLLVISGQTRALVQQNQVDAAHQIVRPMLTEAPAYRQLAMQLAALSIQDLSSAQRWLEGVRAATPDDAVGELLNLAQSWRALDERFQADVNTPRAIQILEELVARPDGPAVASQTLGMIYEAQGRLDAAEAAYRQALQRDPNLVLCMNNLAMVVMRHDPAEALGFARSAVKAAPAVPAFQDTLALVLLANQKPAEAVDAARRAVELDPRSIEWSLTLGETLVAADQTEEARTLLEQLNQRINAEGDVPPQFQQRLQNLQRTVSAQAFVTP